MPSFQRKRDVKNRWNFILAIICVGNLWVKVAEAQVYTDWSAEVVDSTSGAKAYTKIALLPGNIPAIAYTISGARIGYASRTQTGASPWKRTPFPTLFSLLQDLSLTSDATGSLHLSYYFRPFLVCAVPPCPANEPRLGYMTFTDVTAGGAVAGAVVDGASDENAGQFSSIVFDPQINRPHVVYRHNTDGGKLYHAWQTASGWSVNDITSGDIDSGTAIAIGNLGRVGLLYSFSDEDAAGNVTAASLRYRLGLLSADGSSYTWSTASGALVATHSFTDATSLNDETDPFDKGLVIDSALTAHIVFYHPVTKDLMYASRASTDTGTMAATPIDSAGGVGRYASIALCPSNNTLHVAYYDSDNWALKHAWRGLSDSAWTISTLANNSENLGNHLGIACDSLGRIHISHVNTTTQAVQYMTTAWVCGNGVTETGEECDDGNESDTDSCTTGCQAARCGDGFLWTGQEACDSPDTEACVSCRLPSCGDGVRQVSLNEECDDGNNTGGDGCTLACFDEFCGDGVINDNGMEQCDAGTGNSNTRANACRATCRSAACGDGVIDTNEQCDGGMANSDTVADRCRVNCLNSICGDRVVDTNEQCDDGNTIAGDGCNTNCRTEVQGSGDSGGSGAGTNSGSGSSGGSDTGAAGSGSAPGSEATGSPDTSTNNRTAVRRGIGSGCSCALCY